MHNNYFDYGEPLDIKTRTSTFSKVSESREDISRQMFGFNPFIHGGIPSAGGFFNPVEED